MRQRIISCSWSMHSTPVVSTACHHEDDRLWSWGQLSVSSNPYFKVSPQWLLKHFWCFLAISWTPFQDYYLPLCKKVWKDSSFLTASSQLLISLSLERLFWKWISLSFAVSIWTWVRFLYVLWSYIKKRKKTELSPLHFFNFDLLTWGAMENLNYK